MVFIYIQTTWVAPIIMAIITYVVYIELGWTAFIVTGYFLLQLPLQVFFGRCFAYLRLKSAEVTDKRVRIMNEIISGIRVVKMYAWDYAFKNLIRKLRRKESNLILEGGIIRACGLGSVNIALTTAMFIVFSVYTATGGELSPRKVFITLSLLIILRLVSVQWSVHNVLNLFEGWVALVRLQKFFVLKELAQQESKIKENVEGAYVEVNSVSASWSHDQESLVLNDLSFKVNQHCPLLAVVGPVGVGKSSLLQCLLGELQPLEGSVSIEGKVSYASQEAWVFSATVRENILFGQPYKPVWYNSVIKACALDKGHTEVYGSLAELEAMGVDPNQLLGLITHQKEEEEAENKEQFCIKDDQKPEDEDQSEVDLLEEPNGIAIAPSMTSLHSKLN